MEIQRRTIAALLALTMVFTTLPIGVRAEENEEDGACIVPETVQTEPAETVEADALIIPEAAETEALETLPETTIPEETWEVGDIVVEETAEAVVADSEILASGKCSSTVSWTLNSDYVLTISGEGSMGYDDQSYLKDWKDKILSVVIEPGITRISDRAFLDCYRMTSVIIPDTVVYIGRDSFSGCWELTGVEIPDSVTTIGVYAFYRTAISDITIPSSVKKIGNYAFGFCDDLHSVTIMEGVTEIGEGAFGLSGITSVVIPDSVRTIGKQAFFQCGEMTSVTIGDGVESLGESAFSCCGALESVTIPGSITQISKRAFYSSTNLKDVTIENGVVTIGEEAFWRCTALERVTIPDSVVTIEDWAFFECDHLLEVEIPESVAYIGDGAFGFCDSLQGVIIPDGVTYLGASAFSSCDSLQDVTIPASIKTIRDRLFWECTSLTAITIPKGIMSIGKEAFQNCTSLTSAEIPDGIISIGEYAFDGCESLSDIKIPDTVTTIGAYAFGDCESVTSVVVPDSVTYLGSGVFSGCENLTSAKLSVNIGVINSSLFSECEKLPGITIPDGVTSIGGGAFFGCESFTNVVIPDGVSSLGWRAFAECTNLISITIPDSVTSLGYGIFEDCTNLMDITIPDSVTSIGYSAFESCSSITDITIPDGVTAIEKWTFWGTGISSITIPEHVTSIGQGAFGGCESLTRITFGENITKIYPDAFKDSRKLKDIYYGGSEEAFEKIDIHYSNYLSKPNLDKVTIHYNVPIAGGNAYHLKLTPDAAEYSVMYGQKLEIACALYKNNEEVTSWGKPSLTMKNGGILEATDWRFTNSGWCVTMNSLKPGRELLTFKDVGSGRYIKVWVEVTPAPIWEYIDNSKIRINGSGSAYAYYQGDPNEVFAYTLNGKSNSVTSNDKGVIRIPLGTFKAGGTYENTVQFLKVGNKGLSPAIGFKPTVIATQLEYSHEFQVSLDAGVGVAIGEGLGVKLGTFKAMATLGQLGTGAGLGGAITVIDTYAGGSRTLEVMDQTALDAYGSFDSGISGETKVVELDILSSSTKIKANGTGIYGLRIRNYSEENKSTQKAIATFFLGEALKEKSNNIYLRDFQNWLAKKLYTQSTVDVIDGSGAAVSGAFEAGGANLEIGNLPLITGLKSDLEATASISGKTYGNGDSEYATSITADMDMDLASLNLFDGVVGADYLGKDITVKVSKEDGKKTLETISLSSEVTDGTNMVKGEHFTADYNQFVFEEDSLEELMKNAKSVDDYINGNRIAANNADMEDIASVLSGSDVPVEYADLEKTHFLATLPLEFGVTIGVGVDFGLTASYMQSVEHQTAGGFVKADEILINSESKDYSAEMDQKLLTLDEWLAQPFVSLAEEVKEFFEKLAGTIQEGVETAWGWIEGKADSLSDWMVSLMGASSEEAWAESAEIDVKSDQVNFALAKLVNNSSEAYATRNARTIGRPFIVNVTDGTTGEQIKDFSMAPLTFTIRYASEDLLAANYDAGTQTIAMYRYSDDGDYFEYIGGIHDAEAKTVTAAIIKPGQYILAAEEIPEEEPGEDAHEFKLGDVNHDSKINAKDATLILQSSVGVLKDSAKFCEQCAEVSGDGKLNAKDSTLILQFSVGLRESFPGQK